MSIEVLRACGSRAVALVTVALALGACGSRALRANSFSPPLSDTSASTARCQHDVRTAAARYSTPKSEVDQVAALCGCIVHRAAGAGYRGYDDVPESKVGVYASACLDSQPGGR